MTKAREMVAIATRYAVARAKQSAGEENSDAQYREYLVSVGIASPVTKANAGTAFHTQLARQLADWLSGRPLQHANGVITLTDLYCLFNRARGTEMISPDDLLRACLLFDDLKLPVKLRTFPSGVKVVQDGELDDNEMASALAEVVRAEGPMTAFTYAKLKRTPVDLARELMVAAESAGFLCRDETLEGLVFYPNFFPYL